MVYSAGFSLWDSTESEDSLVSRVPLANLFAHKRSSGAKKEGKAIGRVKKVVHQLNSNPASGVSVSPLGDNFYNLHAVLQGPPGTLYEGGEFHISVKLPFEYPNKAPNIRFLTKIYHVNFDQNGKPCPGQVGLSSWSPSNTLATLFENVRSKLGDPDDSVPQYTPVGDAKHSSNEEAYNRVAREWTKKYAVPGSAPPAISDDPTDTVTEYELMNIDLSVIGRDYLILDTIQKDENTGKVCGGLFRDEEDSLAVLPRIKLVFSGAAQSDKTPASEESVEVNVNDESIVSMAVEDGALKASVIKFCENTDSESGPLKNITAVYHLESHRAKRYATIQDGIKPDGSNAVAVVGEDMYGDITEMIVRLNNDLSAPEELCQIEDTIMMEQMNLMAFPEYRFSATDPWKLCTGGLDGVENWRRISFKLYEESIRETPPSCLAGLGRLLWLGPITHLYANANDQIFPMPESEQPDWTVVRVDEKTGKEHKTYLPRTLHALRIWNPTTRAYEAVETKLEGSPGPQEKEAWFKGIVRHLKTNFQGPPAVDAEFLAQNEADLLCPAFIQAINSGGANNWSDLVFKVKGEVASN
jgi:ubiquitin-protein ligase